jgi:non-ribosomal peptide synthetase component E (peptide arylation enzyme)
MLRDPSGWKPRLDAEVIARYRVEGAWRDRTIADRLDDLCERQPGQTLVVDGVRSLSAAKVRKLARRLG